ncbi:MAG: hypothetical protein JNL96_04785 [Planctomycetaceae bacterium]|nr:hypothetical protein [Planctomycetaceae bacterium]
MTTVSIHYENSNDEPMEIQVDPWAGLYRLAKGESIEFVAQSQTESPKFTVEERGNLRIITFVHSSEFFVLLDGKRIHWTKYPHNF